MATIREKLEYGQLTAGNTFESLLNLNDGSHFYMKSGTFKILPAQKLPVIAQNQRRWGGGREVAETHENGHIEWTCGVSALSTNTTTGEQEALVKVEEMLARLEANPYREYILWQLPGVTQPTLYEVRGAAIWTPEYDWSQFEGANLFLFNVQVPIGPLAQGLPQTILTSGVTALPAVFNIPSVPGDAPAKTEVAIETNGTIEETFITGGHSAHSIAIDASHIYWCNTETGFIGRAALAGGTVEQSWLNVGGQPVSVAVNATNIYWADIATGDIGRATIAGATIEKTWLLAELTEGAAIAVDAAHIYFTRVTAEKLGRAAIGGTALEKTWTTLSVSEGTITGLAVNATNIYALAPNGSVGVRKYNITTGAEEATYNAPAFPLGGGIAIDTEYIYLAGYAFIARMTLEGTLPEAAWTPVLGAGQITGLAVNATNIYGTGVTSNDVFRGALANTAAPIWALIGWASKPSAGLATAPFGILPSSEAEVIAGKWTFKTVSGARGGKALAGLGTVSQVVWNIDPATMVPDSFSGELSIEVWARVWVGTSTGPSTWTLSTQPQDGTSFGASRYTDEWGSSGRTVAQPQSNERFRLTRLGTLHLVVSPLAPRIWKLVLAAEQPRVVKWGVDYLLLCPSMQRACSPSSKLNNSSFPQFFATAAAAVKTIRSDLSATIARAGKFGHPDKGLGGQQLALPPGESQLLVKLSSLVPDEPEKNAASEQLAHEAKVTVVVTPQWFLGRTT